MQGFIEKVIKNLVISHLRDFIDLFRCVKVSFTFYIAMLYFFFLREVLKFISSYFSNIRAEERIIY